MNLKFYFFSIFFLLLACKTGGIEPNPKSDVTRSKLDQNPDAQLKVTMVHLKNELDHLLPYVIKPQVFHSEGKRAEVKKHYSQLKAIADRVTHEPALNTGDPLFSFLTTNFQEDIKRGYQAYENGQREFARLTLLNVSAYCIECHTRTKSGAALNTETVQGAWSEMRPIDQLDYLVATRQFDKARDKSIEIARNGLTDKVNVFDIDRAVRLGLLVTVRFEQNPDHALKIVEPLLLERQKIPFYLKSAALTWKIQLEKWKLEKPSNGSPLVLARALSKRALSDNPKERHFDIEMLRIQAILHPFVSEKSISGDQRAEALFLLGLAYDITKDLATWSIHESYYESCIRSHPKSTWADRCYDQLEKSIYLGYTGSRGTYIPPEVHDKLQELKKLTMSKM